MKKILVLYTGGTIGMDYTDDGLQPVKGLFKSQLDQLTPVSDVEISLIEYDELIDSSDIGLAHWQKMVQDIAEYYEEYNGFVIVHGTDTMAYTASVLAFALRGLDKPVILTGAQLPLVHRRSDGWNNLIDALCSAAHDGLHEVCIAFNHKLLRGARAQKISTSKFIGFDSLDEAPMAEFGINIAWYPQRWIKSNDFNFSPIIPKDIKVLDLSLRPGFTTDFIIKTLNNTSAQAIILQTYGSGNIPIHNQALVDAIQNATARGILIVNITQVIEGRVTVDYAGGNKLSKLGVIDGCDMTVEAALGKLLVLLSTSRSHNVIKRSISKNLVGELTEITKI